MDLNGYEQRFRRAGLPLFIEEYSATHDIFNRAAPFLALVFVAEMLGATSFGWGTWQNVAAAVAGLVVLIGGFGLLNLVRGRRFWSLPTRFGIPELAVFVLLPALLPLVTENQLRQFFGVALSNLVTVGLVYVVVGYGLFGTLRWGFHRLGAELGNSLTSLIRALPLLLVFSLVLFVNTEMWQVFAGMPVTFVILIVVLFSVLADGFLIIRLPSELDRIERDAGAGGPALTRLQRLNLSFSLVVRQWLQAVVVSTGVGLFFVAFGMLTVRAHIYQSWEIDPGRWQLELQLLGHPVVFTESLAKVATGIAAFTGLYYSIALMTDASYRAEFLDNVSAELREIFVLRSEYLRLRAAQRRDGPAE